MVEKKETSIPGGLPLYPMSVGPTTSNRTGSWKYLEPYFEEWTAPCSGSCPVRNDISTLMRLAEDGEFEAASLYLLEHNPFPATLGRGCSHPCEQPCNRKAAGGAVRIQGVERFLGDYAATHDLEPRVPEATRSAVAVIGAGPAGLSSAYFLRLLGHDVTVYERSDRIGGQLMWETPSFRVPSEPLGQELDRLYRMGIRFELGQTLGATLELAELRARYPAVVLAVGPGRSRGLGVPRSDHAAVLSGSDFLEKRRRGASIHVGRHVVVVGGSRLALDCARTLRRLDKDVRVVFDRSRGEMPAPKPDVSAVLEEGIPIELQRTPVRLLFEGDSLTGVECARTDGDRLVPDSEHVFHADTVIVARDKELALEEVPDIETNGCITTESYRTSVPGVYACGDCASTRLPGEDAIALAVASGREAAARVHEDLEGVFVELDPLRKRSVSPPPAKFKDFARAYLGAAEPAAVTIRLPEERVQYFSQYIEPLDGRDVVLEAGRCIKCGTCILCDNCRLFCPDAAIVWKADRTGYEILTDFCKGCGVCVEECPRAAIHMRRVDYRPGDVSGDRP